MHTMTKVCMKTFTMGTKRPIPRAVCTIVAKKFTKKSLVIQNVFSICDVLNSEISVVAA